MANGVICLLESQVLRGVVVMPRRQNPGGLSYVQESLYRRQIVKLEGHINRNEAKITLLLKRVNDLELMYHEDHHVDDAEVQRS